MASAADEEEQGKMRKSDIGGDWMDALFSKARAGQMRRRESLRVSSCNIAAPATEVASAVNGTSTASDSKRTCFSFACDDRSACGNGFSPGTTSLMEGAQTPMSPALARQEEIRLADDAPVAALQCAIAAATSAPGLAAVGASDDSDSAGGSAAPTPLDRLKGAQKQLQEVRSQVLEMATIRERQGAAESAIEATSKDVSSLRQQLRLLQIQVTGLMNRNGDQVVPSESSSRRASTLEQPLESFRVSAEKPRALLASVAPGSGVGSYRCASVDDVATPRRRAVERCLFPSSEPPSDNLAQLVDWVRTEVDAQLSTAVARAEEQLAEVARRARSRLEEQIGSIVSRRTQTDMQARHCSPGVVGGFAYAGEAAEPPMSSTPSTTVTVETLPVLPAGASGCAARSPLASPLPSGVSVETVPPPSRTFLGASAGVAPRPAQLQLLEPVVLMPSPRQQSPLAPPAPQRRSSSVGPCMGGCRESPMASACSGGQVPPTPGSWATPLRPDALSVRERLRMLDLRKFELREQLRMPSPRGGSMNLPA